MVKPGMDSSFIDDAKIEKTLQDNQRAGSARVAEILAKSRELSGLDQADVAALMSVSDPELLGEMFQAAREVKEIIYGRRLVLFAPLYVSNLCNNECTYCAFRARNKEVPRKALSQEEIAREVRCLIEQGHKRILLVAGESYPQEGLDYILRAIDTIYQTSIGHGEIRRVNVNIAPLSVEDFQRLKAARIGTYQIFQETYHRDTYHKVHLGGVKKDYDWRVTAVERAMTAGIDDVGIGVLFGLFDWRFEILALMQHIQHLESHFGIGPHTISVPRMEPASGSDMSLHPPHAVEDIEFRKLVAILRLAVPYTGIIMSTRENPNLRRETFALGVSQISAGSRTNPGGYSVEDSESGNADSVAGQFSLGDHRSLAEVIQDISSLGYLPSFCTACYRLGRTGGDFMDLARPGEIKLHCDPNAIATFQEYLEDYADAETKKTGEACIEKSIEQMPEETQQTSKKLRDKVIHGERDVFV